MLYHGSPHRFEIFQAPDASGNIRPSEEGRRHHNNVIFLAGEVAHACSYAGPGGFLYVVDARAAKVYDQAGKRKPRINRDVYVARPEEAKIILRLKLAPRKRNQAQEYILEDA